MRGFVYNLPYNVNKKFLLWVKYRVGLRGCRAAKTLFVMWSTSGEYMPPQVVLKRQKLYQLQTACQQLQGMQYLDTRTVLLEAIG